MIAPIRDLYLQNPLKANDSIFLEVHKDHIKFIKRNH